MMAVRLEDVRQRHPHDVSTDLPPWAVRQLVRAVKKYNRICQHGSQSRSNPGMIGAMEYIHAGKIGEVKVARGLCYKPRDTIGARGTFSLFPLGDHDTVVSSVPFLNTLSYGTAHAFTRAIRLKREQINMGTSSWSANLTEFGYFGSEDQAFADYFQKPLALGKKRFSLMQFSTSLNLKQIVKPHVVLVVMESWGQYGTSRTAPALC